jgi:hypothetical protein
LPVAIVTVTSPSALELLEVFTVTVWGTFQLSGVKVSELGDKEVTPSLLDVIGIVTGAVGAEVSTAV